jgi:hypothetical protein
MTDSQTSTTVLLHDTKVAEIEEIDSTKSKVTLGDEVNSDHNKSSTVIEDKSQEVIDKGQHGADIITEDKGQELPKETVHLGNEVSEDDKANEIKETIPSKTGANDIHELGSEVSEPDVLKLNILTKTTKKQGANDVNDDKIDESNGLNGNEVSEPDILKLNILSKTTKKQQGVDDVGVNGEEVSDPDVLKLKIKQGVKVHGTEDPDILKLNIQQSSKGPGADDVQDDKMDKANETGNVGEIDTLKLNIKTNSTIKGIQEVVFPDVLTFNLDRKTTTTEIKESPDVIGLNIQQKTTTTTKQEPKEVVTMDIKQTTKTTSPPKVEVNIQTSQSFTAPPKEKPKAEPIKTETPKEKTLQTSQSMIVEKPREPDIFDSHGGLDVTIKKNMPMITFESAHILVKDQPQPISIGSTAILIKLKKRWMYKVEIRFYVNVDIEAGCMITETISTLTSSAKHASKLGKFKAREERYVITLPERQVLFSIFSKTSVKIAILDLKGKILIPIQFAYDCK